MNANPIHMNAVGEHVALPLKEASLTISFVYTQYFLNHRYKLRYPQTHTLAPTTHTQNLPLERYQQAGRLLLKEASQLTGTSLYHGKKSIVKSWINPRKYEHLCQV
jgi:hypothetical protein